MHTSKKVLQLWGEADQAVQKRLKLKYLTGLSERKFPDDFVGFLANEFELDERRRNKKRPI